MAKLKFAIISACVSLADTGKGTVAKPEGRDGEGLGVLPTLEKELWQSVRYVRMPAAPVLPTLEKELWQS